VNPTGFNTHKLEFYMYLTVLNMLLK